MFSTWKAVASSGRDAMTMSRSSFRIRCTQSTVSCASLAGSTVKTWSYLFLKYRASLARRPARASATGEDSRPTVETFSKSTVYAMRRWSLSALDTTVSPWDEPFARGCPGDPCDGAYRDRTGDPQLAKLVLSQLS